MGRLGTRGWTVVAASAALLVLALTIVPSDATRKARSAQPRAVDTQRDTERDTERDTDPYSNIRAADYVGPARCAECHKKRYRQWRGNLHRAMNRLASDGAAAVFGDFSGVTLAYADGVATFETRAGAYFMTLARNGEPPRRFEVTRTIGSRYMQEYVGRLVSGPEPEGHPLYSTETRLPFGYWFRKRGWFHQQYYDSWYGPEYGSDGAPTVNAYRPDETPWATRCAWCHNTYPFEIRALRSDSKRMGHGPAQFFSLARHGQSPQVAASITERNRLPVESLVTVGISCESCHLGGREHADNDREISFVPRSPDLIRRGGAPAMSGGRDNNLVVNAVCGQCHSTPAPDYPDGGATRASREALDLAASPCISAIKCTDCHDPHVKGAPGGATARAKHVAACVRCHDAYASADAVAKHTRHPASVTSCLDCHMPRQVQGLSNVIRTHRISSPTNAAMLAVGAPNACNLCHLDKSIRWTLHALEDGWRRHIQPLTSWQRHYGKGLARPVGKAWLASERPASRVAAAAAYGRWSRTSASLALLLDVLDDPVAHYRMWMLFAVEELIGRSLTVEEYDPRAAPRVRARKVRRLRSNPPTITDGAPPAATRPRP